MIDEYERDTHPKEMTYDISKLEPFKYGMGDEREGKEDRRSVHLLLWRRAASEDPRHLQDHGYVPEGEVRVPGACGSFL